METHARYLLVGISSLIATIILIIFVLWLGKLEFNRAFEDYDVRFHESVSGLSIGAIVQLNGIQVGQVRRLGLDQNNPAEVSVIVRLQSGTPVSSDTRAQLTYTGLTGVAAIELLGSTANSPRLLSLATQTIPRIESIPSTLGQLMRGGGGVMERAQVLINKANAVLSEQNIQHISKTLAHLEMLSGSINDNYPEFSALIRKTQNLEAQLITASKRANLVLAQMHDELAHDADHPQNLRAQSAATLLEIRRAAEALNAASQAAISTLAQADQNITPEIASTLQSLQMLSAKLEQITEHFDQAPAHYLLGAQALPTYHVMPNQSDSPRTGAPQKVEENLP
jgi:phospholipid/cholesterol/gamma-HCH transport system substrate-binding protein